MSTAAAPTVESAPASASASASASAAAVSVPVESAPTAAATHSTPVESAPAAAVITGVPTSDDSAVTGAAAGTHTDAAATHTADSLATPASADSDPSSSTSALSDDASFTKTLSSDVGESAALALLREVVPLDPVFSTFNALDLELLARYLSVLRFEVGEKIISKDEPASFCGIILQGKFEAVISESQSFSLGPGSLVGEMSYFEGGKRTADIVSAAASVLAVISFADLRKLQDHEPGMVSKFLHVLATVSIRKLRNMINNAPAATTATAASAPSTPAAPTANPSSPALSSASIAGRAAAAGAHDYVSENIQESLFLNRLLKESAAAVKSAEAAKKESAKLSKKERDAGHKIANVEAKNKTLQADLDLSQAEGRKLTDALAKTKERAKLLTEQLATLHAQKIAVDKELHTLQAAHFELHASRVELTRQNADQVASLETRLDAVTKTSALYKTSLDAEITKTSRLAAALDDVTAQRAALDTAHRQVSTELDTLKVNHMLLTDRAKDLERARRDFDRRMNEEELASMSWKAKSDLYLGDYSRANASLKELEGVIAAGVREKRATLRRMNELKSLLRKVVVRNFVRAARTRKLLFAIFARVNQVSAQRISIDASLAGGGAGATVDVLDAVDRFGGAASTALGGGVEASQAISLRQVRQDRSKLQAYLKSERTPVSRLLWLLDEELSAFESPFHALQSENAQLRATLDAFFKRNIQLMNSFMMAKTTYEALHAEYKRCKESWERMAARERALLAANGGQHPIPNALALAAAFDNHELQATSAAGEEFAASIPTPAPFSPGSSRSSGNYSSTLLGSKGLPEAYAGLTNLTLRAPPPASPPPPATKGRGGSARPRIQVVGAEAPAAAAVAAAASPASPSPVQPFSPTAPASPAHPMSPRSNRALNPNPLFYSGVDPSRGGSSDVGLRSQALRDKIHSITSPHSHSSSRPGSSYHLASSEAGGVEGSNSSRSSTPASYATPFGQQARQAQSSHAAPLSPSGGFFDSSPPPPSSSPQHRHHAHYSRPSTSHGVHSSAGGNGAEEKTHHTHSSQSQSYSHASHSIAPSSRPQSHAGQRNMFVGAPPSSSGYYAPYPHVNQRSAGPSNAAAHAQSPPQQQGYDSLFPRTPR